MYWSHWHDMTRIIIRVDSRIHCSRSFFSLTDILFCRHKCNENDITQNNPSSAFLNHLYVLTLFTLQRINLFRQIFQYTVLYDCMKIEYYIYRDKSFFVE